MIKTSPVPVTISRGDTSATVSDVSASGYLKGVSVTAGAMQDGSTYTVSITDKNGMTVYNTSSLSPNSTTTNWADLYGGSTAVHPLEVPMAGPVDVTITASKAQNNADVACTVYIYFD
jgi:hypothetical protein